MKSLSDDNELHISKFDRNNTTVLMNMTDYIEAGTNHLNSPHYVKINQDNTSNIVNEIENIAQKLYTNSEIDLHTYKFLISYSNAKHGNMYFLPKIHKIDPDLIKKTFKEGFSQTEIQIPMRPIINKCSSPTRRIEKFLDLIFKPLLRKESFYIQDTKDFITRIESLELKDDCILVAYDVTSMYTNMRITDLQKTLTSNLANINQGLI